MLVSEISAFKNNRHSTFDARNGKSVSGVNEGFGNSNKPIKQNESTLSVFSKKIVNLFMSKNSVGENFSYYC